jgi:Na+/melibiose symporter-like transporter
MSAKKKENTAIVGVGVAACAVCCAGPILGVLAAIGLGTAAGFALFGTVAIVIGAMSIAFVLMRRRRRAADCGVAEMPKSVPVELTGMRSRS